MRAGTRFGCAGLNTLLVYLLVQFAPVPLQPQRDSTLIHDFAAPEAENPLLVELGGAGVQYVLIDPTQPIDPRDSTVMNVFQAENSCLAAKDSLWQRSPQLPCVPWRSF